MTADFGCMMSSVVGWSMTSDVDWTMTSDEGWMKSADVGWKMSSDNSRIMPCGGPSKFLCSVDVAWMAGHDLCFVLKQEKIHIFRECDDRHLRAICGIPEHSGSHFRIEHIPSQHS